MKIFYGQAPRPGRNSGESSAIRKRILFDLLLLSAVFYAPWWCVAILAFIGAFLYPLFYEIIAVGVILDLLYGARTLILGGYFGTMSAVIIFLVAIYARKAVR